MLASSVPWLASSVLSWSSEGHFVVINRSELAPGLMHDESLPIHDAESLLFYPSVSKLVLCVCVREREALKLVVCLSLGTLHTCAEICARHEPGTPPRPAGPPLTPLSPPAPLPPRNAACSKHLVEGPGAFSGPGLVCGVEAGPADLGVCLEEAAADLGGGGEGGGKRGRAGE